MDTMKQLKMAKNKMYQELTRTFKCLCFLLNAYALIINQINTLASLPLAHSYNLNSYLKMNDEFFFIDKSKCFSFLIKNPAKKLNHFKLFEIVECILFA